MAQKSASFFSVVAVLLCFMGLTLTGCNFTDLKTKVLSLNPLPAKTAASPLPSAIPSPEPLSHQEINAEFIKEVLRVVMLRDIRSEEEFSRMMNTLDQGGHYEGIYNGIVYSAEYRTRETGSATVSELKLFAEILTQLLLDQKYDPLKIPAPSTPDVPPAVDPTEVTTPPAQPTPEERKALVAELEKQNLTQSVFTMKRRLGEEVLKTIDLKKEYKEKLATWYGKFSVFLNKKGLDFGIPQRNLQDEYFHYKWALEAEEDRLKWETLNRVHLLMNRRQ